MALSETTEPKIFKIRYFKYLNDNQVYATVMCCTDLKTDIEQIILRNVATNMTFVLPRHELNMRVRTAQGMNYLFYELQDYIPPVRNQVDTRPYPGYKDDPRTPVQTGYRSTPWGNK